MRIISKESGLSLEQHHEQVCEVIGDLWENYLAPRWKEVLPKDLCEYVARVHDIGKATREFQQQFEGKTDFPLPDGKEIPHRSKSHAYYSGLILFHKGIPMDICEVVAVHHGYVFEPNISEKLFNKDKYKTCLGYDKEPEKCEQIWKSLIPKDLPSKTELTNTEKTVLAGMLSKADWIASSNNPNYKFPQIWQPIPNTFEQNFDFKTRPVQKEILDYTSKLEDLGLIIYEAEMGSGKTEVSLQLAQELARKRGCAGVAVAMPTRATTNAMYKRVLVWAKRQNQPMSIQLGNRDRVLVKEFTDLPMNDTETLHTMSFYNRPNTKLGATITCTTIDHLIKSSHKHRYTTIEQFYLAQKVVIIDEVHAYDQYTMEFLKQELVWLGSMKVPVILLSATLPTKTRQVLLNSYLGVDTTTEIKQEAEGYPRLTYTQGISIHTFVPDTKPERKEILIHTIPTWRQTEIKIKEKLNQGYCVGVIVNNVKTAQKVYDRFQNTAKKAVILHSRFVKQDRREREEQIETEFGKESKVSDRQGMLLIATQVAEMSLDFDVDVLFTEIAPIDKVIQRIGRLQRHKKAGIPPETYICTAIRPEFRFYTDVLLERSKEIVLNNRVLVIPDNIQQWVDECYDVEIGLSDIEKADIDGRLLPEPNHVKRFLRMFIEASQGYKVRDGDEVSAIIIDYQGNELGEISLPLTIANSDYIINNTRDIPYLYMDENNLIHIDDRVWVYSREVGLYEKV